MADQPICAVKTCTKCDVEYPADRVHFPPVGKGLRPSCRSCWREHEREYFWANRERKREAARQSRARGDKIVRSAKLAEWRKANPEKVRANDLRRLAKIKSDPSEKAKAAARTKLWRSRNPEAARARSREAYRADPEKARAATKAWRDANPEAVRAKEKAYREANPEKIIADSEKRRARMLQAEGEFTGHDVISLIKLHGRTCYYCSKKLKRFEVDHFIPLSRGGTNWPSNLVIACGQCNRSKSNKMPWEWQPQRFQTGCSPR